MTKRRSMMQAAFAFLIPLVAGLGVAHAGVAVPVETGVTSPLYPPITGSPVTVSIFSTAGVDITDTWMPTWNPTTGGEPVLVVVNTGGGVLNSVTLTPAPLPGTITFDGTTNPFLNATTLATSAYPGKCTNVGSPADADYLDADFVLGAAEAVPSTAHTGFRLTPRDCGGMAVIQAVVDGTLRTFVLPQDSNGNGIPDAFEAVLCPASHPCPTGREDVDSSAGNPTHGDGISVFDEYRGFIVSGGHIRTDPRQKDLFVHLVNPQCVSGDPLASTASLLGGGTTTHVTGNTLFSNVETLVSSTQVHRLGYAIPNQVHVTTNEWVDHFHHYSVADGLRFGDGTLTAAPPDDRQVNRNAVYFSVDGGGIPVVQKGLRLIECVDTTSSPSLLGFASLGSPNGPDNAIIFTHRIVNYFVNSLGATCSAPTTACLMYSTFQNGAWTAPAPISPSSLFGVAFAFYLAMEIGHTTKLTPTIEGTQKTSYGYHHAPGTGSNMDQGITNKVSSRTGNTFYVPLLYNPSDLANYRFK